MTEKALTIIEKAGGYLIEPASWGYSLYDLAAIANYRLGLYQKSYDYAKEACQMEPNDQRLVNNLTLIAAKMK